MLIAAPGEVPNTQNGTYQFKSAEITYKQPQCVSLFWVNKSSISITHVS